MRNDNNHDQYLLDLAKVTEDIAGHNPLQLEHLSAHLEHWQNCAACKEESEKELVSESERRFLNEYHGYMAEKYPTEDHVAERGEEDEDKVAVAHYLYVGKYWTKHHRGEPLSSEVKGIIEARLALAHARLDKEKRAQQVADSVAHLLAVLPRYRRWLVKLALLGFTYDPWDV